MFINKNKSLILNITSNPNKKKYCFMAGNCYYQWKRILRNMAHRQANRTWTACLKPLGPFDVGRKHLPSFSKEKEVTYN